MIIALQSAMDALKAYYNTHYAALCDAKVDGYITDCISDLQYSIDLLDEGDQDHSRNRLTCRELAIGRI